MFESYIIDDFKKVIEDFNFQNFIEGLVYYGRFKGKNMVIKCIILDFFFKVDFIFFYDMIYNYLNIMWVLGLCIMDGLDLYLVFEYVKNGLLKDWIYGGLVMKSQFIFLCYCFFIWRQRLRICLDVVLVLQYMYYIMYLVYIYNNIKSKNIFLDDEFNVKVGNFGLVKCV